MHGPETEEHGWDTASASEFASQAACAECKEPEMRPPGLSGAYRMTVEFVGEGADATGAAMVACSRL